MDLRTLIREEIALARVELHEQASKARAAAMILGIAATSLLLASTFFFTAMAMGIADLLEWPVWAGFLVVATLLSLVGVATFSSARKQLQNIHPVPAETISTLKENSQWIAKRLSSAPR